MKGPARHAMKSHAAMTAQRTAREETQSAGVSLLRHGAHDVRGKHVSGLAGGGLGFGELWPDAVPVVGAQVLERIAGLDLVPVPRQRRAGCLATGRDLVDVLLVNAKRCRNFTASCGRVLFECHSAILAIRYQSSSDSLGVIVHANLAPR